ncbi:hypothetical protein AW27_006415 [Streptomyces sp. PCS3-D2]|uniref:hypothetical protein n=1 Tax=Streptomyces sp. PCS3-D2 TaxID=1460244 RepID=UPI0012FEDE3C|nr:hypothetical protein [Streptomyces sp. PCS3-D2]WKV71196.1 hypothetical protein AW27_006415 [Streptomyces sp. PCS3-D2]
MPDTPDQHTSATDRAALTVERSSRRALRGMVALAGCLLVATATAACAGASAENPKAGGTPAAVKPANADSAATTHRKTPAQIVTRKADDPFPGLFAHLPGTLVVTDGNCVGVKTAKNAQPELIAWGHGWSAREENGKTAVYDAEGKLFAKEGDTVGLAGGYLDQFADHPCATGRVFEANGTQATS